MYDKWSAELDFPVPSFAEFWRTGRLELPTRTGLTWLADFRADPAAHPLGTPSGRIEIFSDTVDAFALPDCAGHPTWYEPSEWLGGPRAARYPLHLIANQPRTRLHSQLDHGGASMASKIRGREPIRIHPDDAAARELTDGDIVRVFNDRGACLAGVVIDDGLRPRWCNCPPVRGSIPPIRATGLDVCARQSQCAEQRFRHVVTGPRQHRPACLGPDREVHWRTAAGARPRATAAGLAPDVDLLGAKRRNGPNDST